MPRIARITSGLLLVAWYTVPLCYGQSAAPAAAAPAEVTPVSQPSLPGSAWTSSGYLSPLEPGNLLTTVALDQGFTVAKRGPHSVTPYAAVTIIRDVNELDWNNKAVSQVGLKYSRAFRNGIVQAGGGYAYERRFQSGAGMGQPMGFANYWFGWDPARRDARSRTRWSSFPGSSWAAVGNYAPAERNNVIASVYVQQGVTVARVSRIAIIPIVEHTLTLDSAGHSWNNRSILGEGVKVRVPVGNGVLETAVIYKHERRWRDDQMAHGLTASAMLWYGWNPSSKIKEN